VSERHGALIVTGRLALADLFPTGQADADTLPVTFGAASWADAGGLTGLRDFTYWTVEGRARRRVVGADGRLRVRLLGVDAPELHYRPPVGRATAAALRRHGLGVPTFRQAGAVRVSTHLRRHLANFGPTIPVSLVHRGVAPTSAIDTYGRLVAWVELPDGTTVNAWLLARGFGVPSLYDGLTRRDRHELAEAAAMGRRALARRWTTPTGRFPWASCTAEVPEPNVDDGRFVHPKLFRRWAAWAVERRAGTCLSSFAAWLDAKRERYTDLGAESRTSDGARPLSRLLDADPARFLSVEFRSAAARVRTSGSGGRKPPAGKRRWPADD